MIAKVKTVAFLGMKSVDVTVEAQVSSGIASFCLQIHKIFDKMRL